MRELVMLDTPNRYRFLRADASDYLVCNRLFLGYRAKQDILPTQRSIFLYEGGTPGEVILDIGHLCVSAVQQRLVARVRKLRSGIGSLIGVAGNAARTRGAGIVERLSRSCPPAQTSSVRVL